MVVKLSLSCIDVYMKNLMLTLTAICALVSTVVDLDAQMMWKQLMPVLPGGNTRDFDIGSDGILYARSRSTVFFSHGYGMKWEQIGTVPISVSAMDVEPNLQLAVIRNTADGDRLILYPPDGRDDIWMNIRVASTWEPVSLPEEYRNKPVIIFGNGDSSIIASIEQNDQMTVVLHSRDYGRNWVKEYETDARHRGHVKYTMGGIAVLYDARHKVLNLRSPDGTWSVSEGEGNGGIDTWTVAGSAIVIRTDSTIHRSMDGGRTWEPMQTGFVWTTVKGQNYSDAMAGLPTGDLLHVNRLGGEHDQIQYWAQGTGRWTMSNDSLPMSLEEPFAISSTAIVAADESGPMISEDRGATWVERKTGIATTPMQTFSVGRGSVVAASIYGDIYYGNVNTGTWVGRRLMSLPRLLGKDSIIDIVQTAVGPFVVKARDIGVIRLIDTTEWSVAWWYDNGKPEGLQSSTRFVRSLGSPVVTVLPHAIVSTLNGYTWYAAYTNDDIVMTSLAMYSSVDYRIGIDTSVYTLNNGAEPGYLFKVWDVGEPFDMIGQGVWDSFHMATISGSPDKGVLRCARAQIGVQGPFERYEVELGSPTYPLYFDFAVAASGNVYITTPKGMYLLRAYGQEIEPVHEDGQEMGFALEWNETYGLTRCSTRGAIEYAADAATTISAAETIVPIGRSCMVYPNPASEYATIRALDMDGEAIVDVVNVIGTTVLSHRVTIIDGRASLDVAAFPSGTYRLRIRNHDAIVSTQLSIVR